MSQRRSKVKQSRVVDGAGFAQFALAQQEQEVACGEGGARGVSSLLALSSSAVRTDILSAVCDLKGDSFQLGKLLILLLQLELQPALPLAMSLIVHYTHTNIS